MDANRTSPQYQLTDELARYCLPPAHRDANRKLAWVNSVCILFLLIGILGASQPKISLNRPAPVAEIIPTIVEPPPVPNQPPEKLEATDENQPHAPEVVAVTVDSPAVNFAVPTIGNLVVPNGVATAPPLNPTTPVESLTQQPRDVATTLTAGDYPKPEYPKLAMEEHQEGTVALLITGDENGAVVSVEITQSSSHPLLDRAAVEVVKRKWTLPRGRGTRLFQTKITFVL